VKELSKINYLSQWEECHGDIGIVKGGNKLLQETNIHVKCSHKVLVDVLHVGVRKDILAVRNEEVYYQWAVRVD
jgi:hypothetical protein